jgi:HK97 family phage portal protein
MGWRDFLFGEKAAAPAVADAPRSLFAQEAKATAVQMPQPAFWLPGNALRSDVWDDVAIGRAGAFGASALVYRCMTFRARKLAEAPLWLADEEDGNEAWLDGTAEHPLAALLEQPNPDQSAAAFLAYLSLAMDMGPALVVKNRDRGGRVASLYVFTADQFTVEAAVVDGVARMFGRFLVADANGTQRAMAPADVLYFPTLGGVSPVDAALSHLNISETMRQTIRASLANSMRPASVTTVQGTLEENQKELFKQSFAALYAGAGNAGRNVVLAGDQLKFQQLSQGLKDLELGPVQGDIEAAICQAFGVHPALVGAKIALENSSGLSDSLKPAQSLFYDLEAIPRWREIETALTAGLLREVDETPNRFVRFVLDDVRALQPDLVANVGVAKNATGIATLNEQRAMIALPPVDDADGDVIAKPTATPAAGTGAAADATKARGATRETKAITRPVTPDEAKAFWERFEAKAAPKRPAYEAVAKRLFREERAGVLATLRGAAPKAARAELERKADGDAAEDATLAERLRAAVEGPYLDAAMLQIAADYAQDGPYAQAWAEEFRALLTVTMEGAAQEFTAGLGVTFSMDDPKLIQAIEQRAASLVQNVLQTTKDAITAAISEGKAQGLTIEQIAKLVDEQAFGSTAAARAQTIANTEVVGAINDAEWTAANAAEVFVSKRWIHARGPGAGRDQHEAHEHEGDAGGWVPMGYAYSWTDKKGNTGTMLRPFDAGLPASEVVSCGCTVAYSDVEPAQAREENPA